MDEGIIGGLDWSTPLKRVNVGRHWRIWVCIVVFTVPAVAVWHLLYPNTFWFDKFWAGVVGSFLGALIGSCWQLWDKNRRRETSGKLVGLLLITWGWFSMIAITVNGPQMKAEEAVLARLRAIKAGDIEAIEIQFANRPAVRVEDETETARFAELLPKAELFYPSHEGTIEEYRIALVMTDDERLEYIGDVRERHTGDL